MSQTHAPTTTLAFEKQLVQLLGPGAEHDRHVESQIGEQCRASGIATYPTKQLHVFVTLFKVALGSHPVHLLAAGPLHVRQEA